MMNSLINRPIILPEDVAQLSRPCDCDDDIIARAIEEASLLDVKPSVGDSLFHRLTTASLGEDFGILLDGGEYTDGCGRNVVVPGLRRTLAYYAWARLVKTSPNHLTRFGYVVKNDDHSHATEWKERQVAYNDAFAVADGYMKQCLAYIIARRDLFPDYKQRGRMTSNRTIFKIIGK